MATPRETFLAGDRPADVAVYLHEAAVGAVDALADVGERTETGVVLVLSGEDGRAAFQRATSLDPMDFAGAAMETEGQVDRDLTGGTCPSREAGDHEVRFVFAFVEAEKDGVGGLYDEGDVVHAYAACACGTTYSDRWLAGADG